MSVMRKFDRNKLAVGLFGSNCDGGLACSTFPEQWDASWENCRELAVRADDAGIDGAAPGPLDLRRRDQSQRFQFRDYCLGIRPAGGDEEHHGVRHGM